MPSLDRTQIIDPRGCVDCIGVGIFGGFGVDRDTILANHRSLLAASDPVVAGRWREEQVWVGSSRLSPYRADFVPPHADGVPKLIEDLAAFSQRADIPALARGAPARPGRDDQPR